MTKFNTALCVAGALLGLSFATASTHANAVDIRFSTPTPPPHIFTKSANKFAKDMDGKLKVKVFSSNKLGNAPTVLSLLQSGAAQMAIIPAGDLARRDASYFSWFIPYTFKNLEQAGKAASTPAAREILTRLEKQGLVGLAYIFPGQRHVLTKFEVRSVADLKNKKVRAFPNDIFRAWWETIGAAPTALPLPEIMPSLVSGVIDGVDVDIDIVFGLKMHKQAKYLTLTNHMAFPGVLLASKKWWDGLDASQQKNIQNTISKLEGWALAQQIKGEQVLIGKLREAGAVVAEPDLAPFKAAGEKVKADFIGRDPLIATFLQQAAAAK